MSTIGLESRLVVFRRRGMALGLAAWAGWGVALAIGALLVGMWLDLVVELPGAVRATWGIAAISAGLILIVRGMMAAKQGVQTAALAQRLDKVAGTRGQILSGVDLSTKSIGGEAVSQGLAEIAIERAGELIAMIKPTDAIPGRPVRKPYLVLGALMVVIGMIGVFSPPLAATQFARFADPFGDHPPYSRLKITVEPGDTRVVYGSGLDVRAKTEGDLVERMDLVMRSAASENDEVLPMFPEGNGQWRATITNVTAAGKYRVKAAGARSRFYNLEVVTVPKLEGVSVRIAPPRYANKAVYEGAIPQNGISGLLGTEVKVFAKSNRPLSRGEIGLMLEGEGAKRVEGMRPVVSGASEVVGSFNIEKNGRMEVRVFDTAGQGSTESVTAQITLLPDERPFVRLIQPLATSYATPTTPIPIEVIAEDDNGVSRVQIFRSLNESRPIPMDVDAPTPNPTNFPVKMELPLAQYGLKPGDVIKIFARVEDNDPAGVKGAESSVSVVQIISEEDYKKMILSREGLEVLQSKYEQARRRLEAVNEAIDKMMEDLKKSSPDGELTEEQKKALDKLVEEMMEHAAQIEKEAMEPLPFDLDKNLTKELEKLAEEMRKEAQKGKPGRIGGVKGALDKLKEMQQALGGDKKEFEEKATEPIEHLAKIYPLLEDEAKYEQLYERQRDFEQRAAALKDKDRVDDPKIKARMRDLETEQAKMKDELRELLEDIQKHTAELPDDPRLADLKQTAEDFFNNVSNSEAAEQMASAEMGLNQFSGSQGHQFAKAAADTLEKFLSKCQGMGEQGMACLKFNPGLAAGMGNTVEQLLEAAGLNVGGRGDGRGGGYSARRNSLNNVGIYGKLPTRSKMAKAGGGKSQRGAGGDAAGSAAAGRDSALEMSKNGRTVGEGDVVVPVKYKRRVGEYFQRVADELKEK